MGLSACQNVVHLGVKLCQTVDGVKGKVLSDCIPFTATSLDPAQTGISIVTDNSPGKPRDPLK